MSGLLAVGSIAFLTGLALGAADYSLGANSYLRKPVDLTEFIAAAAQLGLYWLVLNQTSPTVRSV